MRRLILLRHAKTEREAPSGKDRDRRLDERGIKDAAEMGRWLARHDCDRGLALVSTATRAQETWHLMAPDLRNVQVEHVPALYGADPSELLELVHETSVQDPKQLLIVAHNPGLHEFALGLIVGGDRDGREALATNLPTAGAAIIDFAIDDWSGARFHGGKLESFISPKLLRESSGSD
ncbi:SixA phosphatase family protein [Bradyrhizobium sp. SYSU BS000235]|uniref:SixA phosphatase family protein n=1 Tax=Bradyrhizobium sp. SYSU BS000235 TaxID=3411332 RepID=UPI003C762FC2